MILCFLKDTFTCCKGIFIIRKAKKLKKLMGDEYVGLSNFNEVNKLEEPEVERDMYGQVIQKVADAD